MSVTKFRLFNIVCVVVFAIVLEIYFKWIGFKHPHAGLNATDLAKSYGYPIEEHLVVTEDGYILTVHRIPHGKSNNSNEKRKPVLVFHGFLNDAAIYLSLGPGRALSLLLAENGYDVWLPNARGTRWSKRHKHLHHERDVEKFWDFSFHEIGIYDLAAVTDYILELTGEEQLSYIGYSQGTSIFFVLMSEKPEYNNKFKVMTAMAPATYNENSESPVLKMIGYYSKAFETITTFLGYYEFFSPDGFFGEFFRTTCNENSIFLSLCLLNCFAVGGASADHINATDLAVVYSNTPAGAATKQVHHFAQFYNSREFHKFDFGPTKNLELYGQKEPVPYNISQITTPVAVYYAENDWACTKKDVERFVEKLPNVVEKKLVPSKSFTHFDFVHAKNADVLVYNDIIKTIGMF